jgi:nucleotide-binding universal stress UspA family protein
MRRFLVPTDFSETSKNAAHYAVQLASSVPGSMVILYNVFDKIPAGSDGSPLNIEDDDRKTILNQALKNMEIELHEDSDVRIEYVAEMGSNLVECMARYVRYQGIDLVIMGITGATRLEQIMIGSNTLNFVTEGVCPVIIVPPNAKFEKIENVMLLSDFKNVEFTTPVAAIKAILEMFKPTLHIVNVDSEHYVELTEEYRAERNKLERIFQDFDPQFSFIRLYDFLDAISSITHDRNIDLLITIPRSHSFLKGLFKPSHTKRLAYHSHVPLLTIHG